MGLPQGSPLLVLCNVVTKSLADLNQNGPGKPLMLADDRLIYTTQVQQELDNVAQWCPISNQSKQGRALWCTLESSRQSNASNHVWWNCSWMNQSSEIPWDQLGQNTGLQTACGNNSTDVPKRPVCPEGYGSKGYWFPCFLALRLLQYYLLLMLVLFSYWYNVKTASSNPQKEVDLLAFCFVLCFLILQ